MLAWLNVAGLLGLPADGHLQNRRPSLTGLGQPSHRRSPLLSLKPPPDPTCKWGELEPFSPLGPFPSETLPFLLTGSRPDGKGLQGLSGVPFIIRKSLLSLGDCIHVGGSPACVGFHHQNEWSDILPNDPQ